jgi:hypothetical protein
MIRKHFRIRRIVLGLAFAAIAVPIAQATPADSQVGSDQPISPVQISIHGGVTPTLAQLEKEAQAKMVGSQVGSDQPISPVQISIHGGVTPTLAQLEAEASGYREQLNASQNLSTGFDWGDAGVGASFVFGAALALLTSVALGRRYRSRLDGTGLAST